MIEILRSGPLALVQDAGRPGLAAVGVSPSGAFDRAAFVRGAILVGNDPATTAAIEITLGGFSLRTNAAMTLALTGAVAPADVDGREVPWHTGFTMYPGQVLTLATPPAGLRSYLCVAGGIDVPAVLGSRATDLLSGIGPAWLAAGDRLGIGEPAGRPRLLPAEPPGAGPLRLLPGPRLGWLADPRRLATSWTVAQESNRVGVRLTGIELELATAHADPDLPSEPLVLGAVQLPASGQLVISGPDHPTTGGFPVVAVLTQASSDRLAQCRPGQLVQLAWA